MRGMFALAIYDTHEKSLFLARDRVGIKPLYIHSGEQGFFFASEIKSILTHQAIPRKLNYEALVDHMTMGYPLIPNTFFQNIEEFKPGSWMRISKGKIERVQYWSWKRKAIDCTPAEALEQTETILTQSLEEHLVADVEIAAFLSGGIDSSLLVAFCARYYGEYSKLF